MCDRWLIHWICGSMLKAHYTHHLHIQCKNGYTTLKNGNIVLSTFQFNSFERRYSFHATNCRSKGSIDSLKCVLLNAGVGFCTKFICPVELAVASTSAASAGINAHTHTHYRTYKKFLECFFEWFVLTINCFYNVEYFSHHHKSARTHARSNNTPSMWYCCYSVRSSASIKWGYPICMQK